MREDGQIGAVKKAMDMLRVISDAPNGEIGLKKLSEATGIPKTTCIHILNTLCAGDFAERVGRHGNYALGPMAHYVTRNGKYQQDLIRLCYPVMRWLNRQTGQTVLLSVLNKNGKYIVHYINGERPLSYKGSIYLGHVFETATGRASFSNLDEERRAEFLRTNGMPTVRQWPEAVTPASMRQEMEHIRAKGYVVVPVELEDKLDIGIGAPIFGSMGVVGAIGIAMRYVLKEESMPEEEIRGYVQNLLKCIREINHRLVFEDEEEKDPSR